MDSWFISSKTQWEKLITRGKYFQQNCFPVTYPRLLIEVKKKKEIQLGIHRVHFLTLLNLENGF